MLAGCDAIVAQGSASEEENFILGQGVEGELLECWKQCSMSV